MDWALAARGLSPFKPHSQFPAANRRTGRQRCGLAAHALAPPSGGSSRGKGKGSDRQRRRPTAADVRLAIGVDERPRMDGGNSSSPLPSSPSSASSSTSSSSSRLMDFLATTPIGQPESPTERTLRQFGEWVAGRTEGKAGDALVNLMVLCLSVLPVWILLLLIASGTIKLPFSLPAIEDFIL